MKHETPIDLWLYEKEAFADGFQLVCGVDEEIGRASCRERV